MKRLLILLLVAAVGVGGYYLLVPGSSAQTKSAGSTAATARPVPVVVAAAVQKPMPVELSTIGRVQTVASVAVRSRIDGVIAGVNVVDGQEVKAGDVLFTLDDRALQAAVHQAQAALARDKAQLDNARREVERMSPLAQRDFVSRQAFDLQRTTVASLEATLQADQAAIEAAQVQLSYAVIRAPIAGRLGTINFKVGNSIKANDTTPLVALNQIRPIYVAFSLPQSNFAAIHGAIGKQPLTVSAAVPGDAAAPLDGRLAYIENAIDPTTNTLSVKASFDNGENRLWPGQFVNVTVTLGTQAQAVVVPAEAVQAGQNSPFLYVLTADSTVEARPVSVDRTVGTEAVIAKGLEAGEKVVVSGQLRLDNGVKVEVRPAGGETATRERVS
jgi:multidrug efflux system membrane fusion protein